MPCGELHARTPRRLLDPAAAVEHAGSILSRCQRGRDGRTPSERLHGKKPTQEFVPFGEKVLARPISSEPLNRMNPRYNFGVWLRVRNNRAECFVGTTEGVFRARKVRRTEHQDRWDKEAINNVIGVPWRLAGGEVDCGTGPRHKLAPCHHHQCRLRELGHRGRESPGQTSEPSEPLQDAWVAMRSDLESEHKLTQTLAASGLRNVSKQLQKVQSAWVEEVR